MIWHRTICTTTATYVHLVHDGADYCWCHSLHANGLLWPWCWLLVAMLYLLLWKKRYDFFISTVRCSITHSIHPIHPSRTLIATRWYIRYNFQSHQPLKSLVSSLSYYSSTSTSWSSINVHLSALLGGPCLSPQSWFEKNPAIGSPRPDLRLFSKFLWRQNCIS